MLDNVEVGPRVDVVDAHPDGDHARRRRAMPTATVHAVANQRGRWTTTELMVSSTRPPATMMINGTNAGQSTDGDGIATASTCARSAPSAHLCSPPPALRRQLAALSVGLSVSFGLLCSSCSSVFGPFSEKSGTLWLT